MNDIVRRGFLFSVVAAATWLATNFASAQDLQLELQLFNFAPTGRIGVTLGDRGVLSVGGGAHYREQTLDEEAGGETTERLEVWVPVEFEVYLSDVREGTVVPSVVAGASVGYADESWTIGGSGVGGLGGLANRNQESWVVGAHLFLEAHYFFEERLGVGLGAGPSIRRRVYVDDVPGPDTVHTVRLDWRASLVMRL